MTDLSAQNGTTVRNTDLSTILYLYDNVTPIVPECRILFVDWKTRHKSGYDGL